MAVVDQLVAGNWPLEDDAAYDAALASFGAQNTGVINIPGFPPFLSQIGDELDVLYQLAEIIDALSAEVSYIPVVNVILFIIDIVLLLLPLFAGRPRQQATLNCAHNLLKARNSAANLAGLQILRMFQQWNIVISESGPGEILVANVVAQMVNNLTGQGISVARARGIVLFQFQQGADNLNVIAPALQEPVAAGTPIYGPQGFERIYQEIIAKLVAQGETEAQAEEKALRLLFQNAPLRWIKHIYIGHQPDQPPPGVCPIGEHWDYTLNGGQGGCVHNHAKPPPPPPPWTPPPGTPPLGKPDPDGDEITFDLCQQMADNALATIYTIDQLRQAIAGTGDPECCANLVTAINSITAAVTSVVAAIPAPAGAPVINFDPQINITVPPAPPPAITVNAPPTDVQGIVDQLANLVREGDVKQTILDSLLAGGYLTPEDAQVLTGADWADAIVRIFRTAGFTALKWVASWIGIDLSGAKPVVLPLSTTIAADIESVLNAALSAGSAPIYAPLKGMVDAVVSQLSPAGSPTLFNPNVDADLILAKTLSPVLITNGVMYLADYLGWDVGEQLGEYVKLASELVGLAEVRELKVGQRMRFGPMRYAEHSAKATYMQELPGVGEVAGWLARGIIDKPTAEAIMKFNGRHTDLYPNTARAAQHGFSARQMLRLIETNLFSNAEIADELTFSGMRPVSQHRMLLAAPYLATAPQRNQARTALENAYKEGMLADADLTAQIDSLENNTDRDSLILSALHWDVLITETKALIIEYASLFKVGVWDDVTYRAQLAGLGLQQWKIDLEAGKAEAAANVATFKKNMQEAAQLARTTAAEERKAAMQGFKSGALNAAALSAALGLTGLTPIQAAAWVSLATLQQAGSLRWIYGLLKSPQEATLLRSRVSALEDQRKRLQIDDPTFVGALQAMGIPARYINALRAATDALITPKTAAVTIQVQTT